jgi:hypothetical protein
MNAVAHTSLAIGAMLGVEKLFLTEYKDKTGNIWNMSGMPYIVLRCKSGEIKKAMLAAKEAGIMHDVFVDNMTNGTYLEQIERTTKLTEEEHVYYAAALFGDIDKVSVITKRFSLYK